MSDEVSLETRRADYAIAEARTMDASARYLTARAGGRIPTAVVEEMDNAQADLLRAKRRLEGTERRLAKKRP